MQYLQSDFKNPYIVIHFRNSIGNTMVFTWYLKEYHSYHSKLKVRPWKFLACFSFCKIVGMVFVVVGKMVLSAGNLN